VAVTPTGIISLPLHYLRLTVAGSSSFQTWVGAEDAAGALAYVFGEEVEWGSDTAAADKLGPFAYVAWAENWARERYGVGDHNLFAQRGDLTLAFRAPIAAAYQNAQDGSDYTGLDAATAFGNTVGAIIAEMEVLAGTAGYLDIATIAMDGTPERATNDEADSVGHYYQVSFTISWGEGG